MKLRHALLTSLVWSAALLVGADAAPPYFEVSYPPSTEPGELQLGVTYTVWIPPQAARLRGVIVHQHGCGSGACKGGETAAYDLHWQALAAEMGLRPARPVVPSRGSQNCRLWCDPRNGSDKTFLRALGDLAGQSKHPELETVPWCLWGHSGGGFWSSLMQTMYPERIVAIWFRSGTAFCRLGEGRNPQAGDSRGRVRHSLMCNPGAKEKDDSSFSSAWTGAHRDVRGLSGQEAPIGFAPDPRTAHECGDSRYLAIPFFDACLAMRLPDPGSADPKLKPVDVKAGWLAAPLSDKADPPSAYTGNANEAVWLPNERVAKAWQEYVKSGEVTDVTPPPAPTEVRVAATSDGKVEITWQAVVDLESGLQAFLIERDGEQVGRVPEKSVGKFGRALFQGLSYHDTPEKPLPQMRFIDASPGASAKAAYQVIAINSEELRRSPPAR